ncbi:hypothetical protein C6V83_00040 [Gordonia iterans]|uniref:Uncharacterized protein n=1 Tax=Gordonia iterans TaxID=1004901 RepID=A0A2S0KB52_9ACTN|nr:hypothetical protein [Gordonia iterans]AVL98906.1 hypothetical protein C6V83_00040 [Gordonia iterans]
MSAPERWITTSGCNQTIASLQAFLDALRADGAPEDEPIYTVRRGTLDPADHCTVHRARIPNPPKGTP